MNFIEEWNNTNDYVEVHTSGSTGTPKVMRVKKSRMEASARMTINFLKLREGDNALLCLPDKYIAGKMMIVRSVVGELNLVSVEPCGNPLKEIGEGKIHFAAFTPMQVYNMLQDEESRKRFESIDKIIIGGGAISSAMADELKPMKNEIWSTYGMTETLSHIAMRRLSGEGASEWYQPLDGVKIMANADNCLVIEALHVAQEVLTTNDIAEINDEGRFKIVGRRDNVVCSGGIKLQIEQIESKIETKCDGEFALSWVEDEKLGQALVLCYTKTTPIEDLKTVCEEVLDRFERPKKYIEVKEIPHTETNKIARARLHQIIESK